MEKFEAIIKALVGEGGKGGPITGIDIAEQFLPHQTTPEAVIRNVNAAFLISLCGLSHPYYTRAARYIEDKEKEISWSQTAAFYRKGLKLVRDEIKKRCEGDEGFAADLDRLFQWIKDPHNLSNHIETVNKIWGVFFPEGVSLFQDRNRYVASLRRERRVRITRPNASPVQDPAREILFASNVLLTVPPAPVSLSDSSLPDNLRSRLKEIRSEPQRYWYDHPIQVGVQPSGNEVIYGLMGLDRAVGFEKRRGVASKDTRLNCVLSVSVTHSGLRDIAKPWLEGVLKTVKHIRDIRVYVFTESDTRALVKEVLEPAATHYLGSKDHGLYEIFGVDGEYGRHYSFLKAISAIWQVFQYPGLKGTFKIDLDQVFPQEELVRETRASAFEHLKSPLWGAEGIDEQGTRVRLGMIAGALVNQTDIQHSLFTPDVGFPDENVRADEWIFFSRLPQAVSTEAEMMARYGQSREMCIQRVHVTGGTCGILVESLRRERPFTPTFIGRAEDQAYLLSVLCRKGSGPSLRYVHKDGLIMRHDKESLANEATNSASIGKLVGDYARILSFSYYAQVLPWPIKEIKRVIDPFTGCFVSRVPFTSVYLRLALKGASLFGEGKPGEGCDLLDMGIKRLYTMILDLAGPVNPLKARYLAEKRAWDIFYDLLDKVEAGIRERDSFALGLNERAKTLIRRCEINR
jgi:hypothetical protein